MYESASASDSDSDSESKLMMAGERPVWATTLSSSSEDEGEEDGKKSGKFSLSESIPKYNSRAVGAEGERKEGGKE